MCYRSGMAMTPAEKQAAYRARQLAKQGRTKRPPVKHGTWHGYKKHKRTDSPEWPKEACEDCLQAWADYYTPKPAV